MHVVLAEIRRWHGTAGVALGLGLVGVHVVRRYLRIRSRRKGSGDFDMRRDWKR